MDSVGDLEVMEVPTGTSEQIAQDDSINEATVAQGEQGTETEQGQASSEQINTSLDKQETTSKLFDDCFKEVASVTSYQPCSTAISYQQLSTAINHVQQNLDPELAMELNTTYKTVQDFCKDSNDTRMEYNHLTPKVPMPLGNTVANIKVLRLEAQRDKEEQSQRLTQFENQTKQMMGQMEDKQATMLELLKDMATTFKSKQKKNKQSPPPNSNEQSTDWSQEEMEGDNRPTPRNQNGIITQKQKSVQIIENQKVSAKINKESVEKPDQNQLKRDRLSRSTKPKTVLETYQADKPKRGGINRGLYKEGTTTPRSRTPTTKRAISAGPSNYRSYAEAASTAPPQTRPSTRSYAETTTDDPQQLHNTKDHTHLRDDLRDDPWEHHAALNMQDNQIKEAFAFPKTNQQDNKDWHYRTASEHMGCSACPAAPPRSVHNTIAHYATHGLQCIACGSTQADSVNAAIDHIVAAHQGLLTLNLLLPQNNANDTNDVISGSNLEASFQLAGLYSVRSTLATVRDQFWARRILCDESSDLKSAFYDSVISYENFHHENRGEDQEFWMSDDRADH